MKQMPSIYLNLYVSAAGSLLFYCAIKAPCRHGANIKCELHGNI